MKDKFRPNACLHTITISYFTAWYRNGFNYSGWSVNCKFPASIIYRNCGLEWRQCRSHLPFLDWFIDLQPDVGHGLLPTDNFMCLSLVEITTTFTTP